MKTIKSAVMIATALASALGCYAVTLKVSAERAGVAAARVRIAADTAEVRLLEAELRTRARLPELQRWNEQVLALAPPRAEQFLGNPVQLASFAVAPSAPTGQLATAVVRDAPAAPAPVRRVAFAPGAATPPAAVADLAADATKVALNPTTAVAGFQTIALR